jgi:hypothetical protein
MGELVDFVKFKENKEIKQIEFVPQKYERYCPHCNAPTIMMKQGAGEVHQFDPTNMEAYKKLKDLLILIVQYFKDSPDEVTDDDLIDVFGEGMKDFLQELSGK